MLLAYSTGKKSSCSFETEVHMDEHSKVLESLWKMFLGDLAINFTKVVKITDLVKSFELWRLLKPSKKDSGKFQISRKGRE